MTSTKPTYRGATTTKVWLAARHVRAHACWARLAFQVSDGFLSGICWTSLKAKKVQLAATCVCMSAGYIIYLSGFVGLKRRATKGLAPAPRRPTYVRMTESGLPPDMRARISSLRKAGLKMSVSTACCHTSIRCGRHLFLLSSVCKIAQRTRFSDQNAYMAKLNLEGQIVHKEHSVPLLLGSRISKWLCFHSQLRALLCTGKSWHPPLHAAHGPKKA